MAEFEFLKCDEGGEKAQGNVSERIPRKVKGCEERSLAEKFIVQVGEPTVADVEVDEGSANHERPGVDPFQGVALEFYCDQAGRVPVTKFK